MKLKLILLFILLHFTVYPNYSFTSWKEDRVTYHKVKNKFKWIEKDIFFKLNQKCKKYNLDIYFVCSLINTESNGKNVVSRKNRNGTRDYGYCQINEVHHKKNPKALLNPILNFEIMGRYLSRCLKKANGSLVFTLMYYNGGINIKPYKYKNYNYVANILNTYIKSKEIGIKKAIN